MSRQATLQTLKEYFATKGKFLTMEEYKEAADAPFRFQIVKRAFGSWSRLKGLVGEVGGEVVVPVKAATKPAPKPAAAPKPAPEPAPEAEATEDNG
jgi:hypothetical protein